MQTSESGTALIKAFESCLKPLGGGRFRTYYCPANVLTIGWGTTRDDAPTLHPGDVWSQEECDRIFAASLGQYEAIVAEATASRATPLQQHKFDALVSLAYNCGPRPFNGEVGRAVREGRDADVPAELAKWNKGGGRVLAGLVRRRKAEGCLWMGDFEGASRAAEAHIPGSMPQHVDAPQVLPASVHPAVPPAVALAVATTGTAVASSGISPAVIVGLIGLAVIAVVSIIAIRSRAS